MDIKAVLDDADASMAKSAEYLLLEFSGVRTGKASPALVENIDIAVASYGGSHMKLKQLAVISTPEPRLIQVQPFDITTLKDIERGLRESKLGINPTSDGRIIRLPVPELTEERRRDLVKVIKDMAEQARVRVRHQRRDALEMLRDLQKGGEITEDDLHRSEKEVQELTDKYVGEIDRSVKSKEDEVMTI
jgi:ribosome recycling factor